MTVIESEEPREHVIAYASELGYSVTPAQLARWHRGGLLPRPSQRSLGRGRGTTTTYPHGTAAQLVALCQIRDDERRLDHVAFRLWWEGFAVDLTVIRAQLQAALIAFEADIKRPVDGPSTRARSIEGIVRRNFGQRRLATMTEAAQSPPAENRSRLIRWDASWPPSLDDMAESIGQLIAAQVIGVPAADLLANAVDEDLILARERARSLLVSMQDVLAPLAWLYGKGGGAFRVMDRLLSSLSPDDYVGLVTLMALLTPAIDAETLAALDARSVPPLAEELRLVLAIREQVPGAADVFTPMAVRACLRDKEAARRHRPSIEAFVADHRQEIDAVLTAMEGRWKPGHEPGNQEPVL